MPVQSAVWHGLEWYSVFRQTGKKGKWLVLEALRMPRTHDNTPLAMVRQELHCQHIKQLLFITVHRVSAMQTLSHAWY